MIYQVFSVFDSKAKVYARPFHEVNLGTAVRAWADAVADQQSPFAKHPLDYSLHHLGEYDDNSGSFKNLPSPANLGTAAQHMVKEQ